MEIPFIDLKKQYEEIKDEVDVGLGRVLQKGNFILGEEEKRFEEEFASYCRSQFAAGVNSGTDALFLSLLSLGVGEDDEVILPSFTYIATALAVSYTGARPVFVDIDEKTYNIDVSKIEKAVTKKTKAIIPVHLYGHPVDMKPLLDIADKYNLKVVEDTAQAHGATCKIRNPKSEIRNMKVGGIGDVGCFSFYPTKNLGAAGDGGMVVTNNKDIYGKLLMLRDYGRKNRYEHVIKGYNSRLDTLQAVILSAKLKHLDAWNDMRRANAGIYRKLLAENKNIILPFEEPYARHVYHIFAVRIKNREYICDKLKQEGISVLIHYPIPLHLQEAYRELNYKKGDFPVSEKVAGEIVSLPMYPHINESEIEAVSQALLKLTR